jgi:hypothetical protein
MIFILRYKSFCCSFIEKLKKTYIYAGSIKKEQIISISKILIDFYEQYSFRNPVFFHFSDFLQPGISAKNLSGISVSGINIGG